MRRLSAEDLPSICVHEPTHEHNDSNVVPHGYFDHEKTKRKQRANDDSDEESKVVFKISEKKTSTDADSAMNMPLPLLPPPPSAASILSKKYKEASDDASSSSSETDRDDDNDPLAMFRSTSMKKKTPTSQGQNLITDWEEAEPRVSQSVQARVWFVFVCHHLVLPLMLSLCFPSRYCYSIDSTRP